MVWPKTVYIDYMREEEKPILGVKGEKEGRGKDLPVEPWLEVEVGVKDEYINPYNTYLSNPDPKIVITIDDYSKTVI